MRQNDRTVAGDGLFFFILYISFPLYSLLLSSFVLDFFFLTTYMDGNKENKKLNEVENFFVFLSSFLYLSLCFFRWLEVSFPSNFGFREFGLSPVYIEFGRRRHLSI